MPRWEANRRTGYSGREKGKRPGEMIFTGPRVLRLLNGAGYGFPGAACPVFGLVGLAALAAIGLLASAPYRIR